MISKLLLTSKYYWTKHSQAKMRFYGLSESRIKRVIKSPLRVEEGVALNTVAMMQPASYKGSGFKRDWNQEIWVMIGSKVKNQKSKIQEKSKLENLSNQVRVISAWRYPGKTKAKEGLPEGIWAEIEEALASEE